IDGKFDEEVEITGRWVEALISGRTKEFEAKHVDAGGKCPSDDWFDTLDSQFKQEWQLVLTGIAWGVLAISGQVQGRRGS
ncbi:MAG: hypothetical protein AAGG02_20770, partial [Cyanobacteria bacterium P01_H01_bin.15]